MYVLISRRLNMRTNQRAVKVALLNLSTPAKNRLDLWKTTSGSRPLMAVSTMFRHKMAAIMDSQFRCKMAVAVSHQAHKMAVTNPPHKMAATNSQFRHQMVATYSQFRHQMAATNSQFHHQMAATNSQFRHQMAAKLYTPWIVLKQWWEIQREGHLWVMEWVKDSCEWASARELVRKKNQLCTMAAVRMCLTAYDGEEMVARFQQTQNVHRFQRVWRRLTLRVIFKKSNLILRNFKWIKMNKARNEEKMLTAW